MDISNRTTKILDYSATVLATVLTAAVLLGVVGCKHAHAASLSEAVFGTWQDSQAVHVPNDLPVEELIISSWKKGEPGIYFFATQIDTLPYATETDTQPTAGGKYDKKTYIHVDCYVNGKLSTKMKGTCTQNIYPQEPDPRPTDRDQPQEKVKILLKLNAKNQLEVSIRSAKFGFGKFDWRDGRFYPGEKNLDI